MMLVWYWLVLKACLCDGGWFVKMVRLIRRGMNCKLVQVLDLCTIELDNRLISVCAYVEEGRLCWLVDEEGVVCC